MRRANNRRIHAGETHSRDRGRERKKWSARTGEDREDEGGAGERERERGGRGEDRGRETRSTRTRDSAGEGEGERETEREKGETHLLAVAELDVPLDNATVIHHCGGLAPLPRRCSVTVALSLPRPIAPYDRAPAARHHSRAPHPYGRPDSRDRARDSPLAVSAPPLQSSAR